MIRILLAEDQALLRETLCEVLGREPDLSVVARCGRGDEAVAEAVALQPDVAVLDIEMPGLDGLDAAAQIRTAVPTCRVLMLTVFGRPGYLRRALANGALGFVLKESRPAELADAIRRTAAGERVVDRDLALAALEHGDSPLTEREREVLGLSRLCSTTEELASRLHLAEGTVRNVLSVVMHKLGARSRVDAARVAEERGWL